VLHSDRLSARIRSAKASTTVALADRAAQMKQEGIDVIALAAGEPDFDPPQAIVQATIQAIQDGFTHYTPSRGLPEVRQAIASWMGQTKGLTVNPKTEILLTPGAKQAIYYICQSLLEDGTEALCPDPYWVSYREQVVLAGGTFVPVPTDPKRGFALTRDALAAKVTDRSRLILTNSPSNPTGHVFTLEEMTAIRDIAVEHDLIVMSDEIYEGILYDGHEHRPLATLDGMADRTLTVSGFSKCFAMTGFRFGYVSGPADLISALNKLQQHSATCPAAFVQRSVLGLLDKLDEDVASMNRAFDRRRHLVVDGLNKIEGLSCALPDGAFYAFVDVTGLGKSSRDLALELLEKSHVVLIPGSAFGDCGEGYLRLSFALDDSRLEEAVSRIAEFVARS